MNFLTFTIISAAKTIGVNAYLLVSLCTVETNLRNVNNFLDGHGRGSFGVCQVSLDKAREFFFFADRLSLQQPSFNAKVAALYLKSLGKQYKTNEELVSAYNAGQAVDYNRAYVEKVLSVYEKISR